MSGLRFAAPTYSLLVGELLADTSRETCAIGFARYNPEADAWVVAATELAPEWAYERREADDAILRAAFLVDVANRARAGGFIVILIHTHPRTPGFPRFSSVDDAGELELAEYFGRRVAGGTHLAMVVGPDGCRVRHLGGGGDVVAWEVGETLRALTEQPETAAVGPIHDRQIRAFGALGQHIVGSLRIGVVGAGGTGSVTIQQLTHLGVRDFTIIDPDVVEPTNLNRLVGAEPSDVGTAKVAVAARSIQRTNPLAEVRILQRDVVDADVASELAGLDFVFLCTDSHASRAVVGQIAYQHLVPTIDMGVSITVHDGEVTHVTGRVQMLAPELTCLVCTQALDGEQIRRELMTAAQRAADPYVHGAHEPQPAVISLNSTMASLAVTMFLSAVTPIPGRARFLLYDGIRGTVRPTQANRVEDCIVCSAAGALSRGTGWPLPVRPVGHTHG